MMKQMYIKQKKKTSAQSPHTLHLRIEHSCLCPSSGLRAWSYHSKIRRPFACSHCRSFR